MPVTRIFLSRSTRTSELPSVHCAEALRPFLRPFLRPLLRPLLHPFLRPLLRPLLRSLLRSFQCRLCHAHTAPDPFSHMR